MVNFHKFYILILVFCEQMTNTLVHCSKYNGKLFVEEMRNYLIHLTILSHGLREYGAAFLA